MSDIEVPVLIVGGSLVGMSMGMLLGHHGIKSLVVEHHRGTAIHPRAAQVTQRTMEIFRECGIEAPVREQSEQQFVQDGAIVAVDTLAGRELATFIANLNEGVRDVSPTVRVFVSQSALEPVLKARAAELGADLRFATDMMAFDHDADGVTAVIRHRDTGRAETVRALYLIAADGAHSGIRQQLKIDVQGRGVFSKSATIYFRAEVGPLLRGRNLSVIYVNNPLLRGFFRFEKPFDSGFLAINALGDPANPVTDVASRLNEQKCIELVRVALGSSDVPVAIENVMTWNASADVAERFRERRVFLAGDSAHVMPPNGGFGGNTGVQDAHNLAWKLAYVLREIAGPELLATYETERKPVAEFTAEQAYSRYVTRTAPHLSIERLQPIAPDLEIELGYAYASAAIIAGGEEGPAHEDPRHSRGRPGTRAPHVWLDRNGRQISTVDLFGRSFVVIGGRDGDAWCDAFKAAAAYLGVPADAYVVEPRVMAPRQGSPYVTAQVPRLRGDIGEAYGIEADGAVLVRPDGFVCWRAKNGTLDEGADRTDLAARVLTTTLGK